MPIRPASGRPSRSPVGSASPTRSLKRVGAARRRWGTPAPGPRGVGEPVPPGIWSREQVAGWKRITDAVHEAGGRIVLQLWHVGRISHPIYLDGASPAAAPAL